MWFMIRCRLSYFILYVSTLASFLGG
uniref:Uncharacterized protein n=1 Tax=Anguilla anguilla TaxID=7936 RepID=A0A0E9VKL0_ANGAN